MCKDFIRGDACVSEMERELEKTMKVLSDQEALNREGSLILSERQRDRKLGGSVLNSHTIYRKIQQGHWESLRQPESAVS